ncbi:MAG: hypothetical protein WA162_04175 [Thermodesulfobacteriota bacterium]
MRYFTGQRGKSRLQGHRKRRRVPRISPRGEAEIKIDWLEYKTIRQYQTTAEVLERLKNRTPAGFDVGSVFDNADGNGHGWLTKEE